MSKSAVKGAQGSEASAKDGILDSYDPVSQDKRVVHESQAPGVGTGPASFDYMSEKDKRQMMAKYILASSGAGQNESPYGKVHADKKDIKVIADRVKNLQLAHKDEWISRHVDWTNPSSIAVWRQAAPDFWERRVDYLRKTIDVQGKLAMIVTKGFPTTPEEVELLYMVDTGQLRIEEKGPHMVAVEAPHGGYNNVKRGWIHNIMRGRNPPKTRAAGAIIQGLRDPTSAHPPSGAVSGYGGAGVFDAINPPRFNATTGAGGWS
jgi:hypothetical protein